MPSKTRPKKAAPPDPVFSPHEEKAGDVRVAISEDGHIVYASAEFCALSHIEPSTARDMKAAAILHLDDDTGDFAALDAGMHRVRLNGNREVLDFHFDWLTAPEGKRYLVGSQAGEIFDADQLRVFMDMSEDAMVVLSAAGQIASVNPAFESLFDNAAAGQSFFKLFDQSEGETIRDLIKKSDARAGRIKFESCLRREDGAECWVDWTMERRGSQIYCLGRDVTGIKNHHTALSRREKQLGRAEELAGMGHWHWRVGEDTIEWSGQLYRIFGVCPDSFVPTLQSMSELVHRRDADRVSHVFQRALIGQNSFEVDFRVPQKGGEDRIIRCEGRCAVNDEEGATALYGIMQDMTERTRHEAQLRSARDAAERAYSAKSQFLANMSHELRTPLNAIIGFSEMMQRQLLGPIGTEKYLEYIAGIRDSGGHLLDLISDILDMSKIEAGKYELELQELNVAKTIGMAAHMMEGRALESGVKIVNAMSGDDTLTIVADRRAVLQILLNLLSNAVKFSKEGGTVRVECHKRDGYVALKVIDNGIGIPASKIDQVTRPFEQVSNSYAREHEGSGLGLAITKELAALHGGMLSIESAVDVGTTVTVRLPYDAFKQTQRNGVP